MLRISMVEIPDAVAGALPQIEAGVLGGKLPLDRWASVWIGAALIALINADDLTVNRCFASAFRLHVEEKVEVGSVKEIAEQAAGEFEMMPLVRKGAEERQ
jgi:hypothetical protein